MGDAQLVLLVLLATFAAGIVFGVLVNDFLHWRRSRRIVPTRLTHSAERLGDG